MNAGLKIEHDVLPGPLKHCQITGSENLELIIDLGHQPPCDALRSADQLNQPEKHYPLRLFHCADSGLAQLDYAVAASKVYPPSYPYRAGISWPVVEHHKALAAEILKRVAPAPFCVDVGSNDGTLLAALQASGAKVLGIEPTDVAKIAREENGVETLQQFFTESAARSIRLNFGYGPAQVITCTNAFAHMATLGEVMRGIASLLAQDGMLVIEVHDLAAILEKNQFDSIYHEHLRTYSLKSLMALFPQYGMEIFEADSAERYGGVLRVYVGWAGERPVHKSVGEQLAHEDALRLHDIGTWRAWRQRVLQERDACMQALYTWRAQGKRVAGASCPGRCSTLLNFYGVGPDLIEYLGELPNSLKLGKFLPGRHIPVVSNARFNQAPPDVLVLMAWHYGPQIVERLRREGFKGEIAAPLPTFRTGL